MPIRRSCAKAYLWLRDDLEPLHLARFGTPSQREEVPLGRVSPCGSNGKKKQWIVWVDHHFLCQHFLGIHNPYFQRHGCFFLMWGCDLQKRGLYRQHGDDYMFSQQKCVQQTSWSWLIQGPTVVMSCCIHQLLHLYECGLLKLVCLYHFITPSTTIDITYILHKHP